MEKRASIDALRTLPETGDLVDFSSNDYLGLARRAEILEACSSLIEASHPKIHGATGSRLLTGNHAWHKTLESMLALHHKSESALVFNSGYDANVGFFSSVPQRGDFIFYDELVHASIRDGIKMSDAKGYKFSHNNLADLEILEERVSKRDAEREVYVVTESVFSMDGDSPNLDALSKWCTSKNFHLIVDEAHATGIFGEGRDLICQLQLENAVFARIITFGKAMGCHGAAILGSNELKTYLVNYARSLIYTTALSPHSVAMLLASYQFLKEHSEEVISKLQENIRYFRNQLQKLHLEEHFIKSESAIQCLLIPGNEQAKSLEAHLRQEGFNVRAIRSPTVKQGEERLRFCLHAFNTKEEILRVLQGIKNFID
nr:8-amino-7-oxononanoate synthase [Allomuricauda sp.]